MQDIIQAMQQFGYSTRECEIYLAGLQLWSAPVSALARQLWIHRVVGYDLLQSLEKKGICSHIMKGNTARYTMKSPESFLLECEMKWKTLEQKLPDMIGLMYHAHAKIKVEYFEWLEGIKRQYDEILVIPDKEVYGFFGIDSIEKNIKMYLYGEYIEKRILRNVSGKGIVPDTLENKNVWEKDIDSLRETISIDKNLYHMDCEIIVFDEDKVSIAMLSADELVGVIITSPKLYQAIKSMFDMIWTAYKKM